MARVLVIDDNEDLRELMQMMLEGAGYTIELAADGQAGMAAQRAQPADLVVTDLFMPAQDGIETILQLRSEFPNVKVLAVSGGGKVSQAQSYLQIAKQIGADAILSKPFEQEDLLRTVRELLGPADASSS
ncbi:MAG: response regulator [Myxococcota bacterium]